MKTKFALATAALSFAASGALAQPFDNKGNVEGWNIFFNGTTGGCFMERQVDELVVQLGTEAAMLGEGEGESFGFLAVYTANETQIADGEVAPVDFEIDGERFAGDATGVVRDGYSGGYVVSNSEAFGEGLAEKQTLIIFPDRENPVEIDLTGTKAAMAAVRACQAEMSN